MKCICFSSNESAENSYFLQKETVSQKLNFGAKLFLDTLINLYKDFPHLLIKPQIFTLSTAGLNIGNLI